MIKMKDSLLFAFDRIDNVGQPRIHEILLQEGFWFYDVEGGWLVMGSMLVKISEEINLIIDRIGLDSD